MKQILPFLLPFILLSCSKPNDDIQQAPEPAAWIGTYISTAGDSSFVSQNGDFCKIEWSPKGFGYSLVFDSVRVSPDNSFTTNEITRNKLYTPPWYEDVTATGSGSFKTNKIDFHFTIYGSGDIFYSGIKKN